MKRKTIDFLIQYRRPLSWVGQVILGTMTFVAAFFGRYYIGGIATIPPEQITTMLLSLPIVAGIKGFVIVFYGLNSGLWRYASIDDLTRIIKASFVSSITFLVVSFLLFHPTAQIPRSIYFLDLILTILALGGVRFSIRIFRESLKPALQSASGKRTLIIGAGDAGEIALRSLTKDYMGIYHVVGFLDDDPAKQRMLIHGIPILGKVSDAAKFVKSENITEVLIAISSADKQFIKSIVESCSAHNVNFQIMPAIKSFMTGEIEVQKIRKVKLEDLLGREPIKLNRDAVSRELKGKTILVTGAGGSIGSEIACQVAEYTPSKLILLDYAESPLFEIDRSLREDHPDIEIIPCLVDVREAKDVMRVFSSCAPQRVFHAAAYKHVPLMEQHPTDAIRTNVIGTENLVKASIKAGVEKFVMISTDKAVRPSSIMGATKRICELVVARNGDETNTQFAAVRFGNVLGSNGSVIPIFEKQIERGGPVCVTDPKMTRYFMTIPEAVELVLQTGALSRSNDVFVLDMGTPVKIIDLARNMIELSGMVVDKDIKIKIIGARPGEKTHEELVTYGEDLLATNVDKIRLLRKTNRLPGGDLFDENLEKMKQAALGRNTEEAVQFLWKIITDDQDSAQPKSEDALDRK